MHNPELAAMLPDDAFDFHSSFCRDAELNWARFLADTVRNSAGMIQEVKPIRTKDGEIADALCIQKIADFGTTSYLIISPTPGFLATPEGTLGRPLLSTPEKHPQRIRRLYTKAHVFEHTPDWYIRGLINLLAQCGVSADEEKMLATSKDFHEEVQKRRAPLWERI